MKASGFQSLFTFFALMFYSFDIIGLPILGGVFFSFYVGTKVTRCLFLRFIEL